MTSISLFSVGKTILERLAPFLQPEAALQWNLRTELQKLNGTMASIQALLLDAEEQQEHSPQVKDWLQKLEILLLDAEDLLDDVAIEALREEMATGNRDSDDFFNRCRIGCRAAMAHRVKTLREQLEAIHADNTKLSLTPRVEESGEMRKHTPIMSSIPDIFVGREDDVRYIKEFLFAKESSTNVAAVSIAGIGGMGKTSLAQLVYNDEDVVQEFNLRLWVCVSESFEVDAILQRIVDTVTGQKQPSFQHESLRSFVEEYFTREKYLLVLDDLCNLECRKWDFLGSILEGGASGSKILITTRFENYAIMMSRGSFRPPYVLHGLSSPQSWSLLRLVVSGGDQQLANEPLNTTNVEEIQTEVMKKSVGVPLAVKTLATLLYFKDPQTEWLSFLRSDKLLPADHEDAMLKNLKLSYDYLPSHLKRCFVLCSLFPKDYKIDIQVLICKWIALGLVKSSPNGSEQSLYKLGLEYFMDLTWRSFFQEIKRDWLGNVDTCKMHDLVHDLAVSIAGSTYSQLNDPENEITGDTCYISLNHALWSPSEVASQLGKAKLLRVFSVLPETSANWYQSGTTWDESSFETLVSNSASLRVLEIRKFGVEMLSHHFQELKHLRYLDLSFNDKISRLPDSITMLGNLEVLDLFKCESFVEFPKDFNKLVNLSNLNCGYCLALIHMPAGLGELTRLESLPCFVVGKDSSVLDHIGGLDELKELNNLRGTLQIENLGRLRIRGTTTALSPPLMAFIIGGAAHLKGKIHLQTLSLRWDDGRHGKGIREQIQFLKGSEEDVHFDENLLESLRPHSGLKSFYVTGHKGRKLPSWICSLTQLVNLHLGWCNVQHDLHHLQGLPSLEKLYLGGLIHLEYMDDKDEGAGKKAASPPFFPSLKELELCQCPRLKGWRRKPLQFPKLSKLLIAHCFVLTSMPSFPTLDMELALRSSGIQPLLDTLAMSSAGHINVPSTASCSSSSSSSSPSSSSEVEALQYPLSKLKKKLHISGIDYLPKEWLQGMQHLTSLQEIRIDSCLGMEETLNWHNISHVPNITIDGFLINQDGRSPWDEDHWNNFPRILQMISEEKAKKEGQAESSR